MLLDEATKLIVYLAAQRGWACSEGAPPWVDLPPDTAAWWLARPTGGGREGHAMFTLNETILTAMSADEVAAAFNLGAGSSAIAANLDRKN